MKRFVPILVVICIVLCSFPVFAHSGRTDANGGHYDRSTGEYHYHHGYSAHQHPGGVCPYEDDAYFEDEELDFSGTAASPSPSKSLLDQAYESSMERSKAAEEEARAEMARRRLEEPFDGNYLDYVKKYKNSPMLSGNKVYDVVTNPPKATSTKSPSEEEAQARIDEYHQLTGNTPTPALSPISWPVSSTSLSEMTDNRAIGISTWTFISILILGSIGGIFYAFALSLRQPRAHTIALVLGFITSLAAIAGIILYFIGLPLWTVICAALSLGEAILGHVIGELKSFATQIWASLIACVISIAAHIDLISCIALALCIEAVLTSVAGWIMVLIVSKRKR